jgi:hypothetical protein
MLVMFIAPRLVFSLICAAPILHLRPEALEMSRSFSRKSNQSGFINR